MDPTDQEHWLAESFYFFSLLTFNERVICTIALAMIQVQNKQLKAPVPYRGSLRLLLSETDLYLENRYQSGWIRNTGFY